MSGRVAHMERPAQPAPTGLERLREPFPAHQISKLPKPQSKDAKKGKCGVCGGYHGLPAVHLDYVGHAALTDRLLDADPSWTWEPLAFTEDGLPRFDASGGLWIKLTVCGVTRLGYGHAEAKSYSDIGAREKEVIGDALRNAAMRFGAALDLWHKGDLHLASNGADAETSEQPKANAPDGFDVWLAELDATAKTGTEALRAKWKASPEDCRKFLMADNPKLVDDLRATAAAADNADIDRDIAQAEDVQR